MFIFAYIFIAKDTEYSQYFETKTRALYTSQIVISNVYPNHTQPLNIYKRSRDSRSAALANKRIQKSLAKYGTVAPGVSAWRIDTRA